MARGDLDGALDAANAAVASSGDETQLLGWADGPTTVAVYGPDDLPRAGWDAVADTLAAVLGHLASVDRRYALDAITRELADPYLQIRPDTGRVVAYLVPRDGRDPTEPPK